LADFQETLKYKISLKSIKWEPSWITWTHGQMDGWTHIHRDRQTWWRW